jgi:hypothetical protein
MRFMIPIEADKDTEAHRARSEGGRVEFPARKRTVIDGPFTESKELIATSPASPPSKTIRGFLLSEDVG